MTIIATIAVSRSSLEPMSNIRRYDPESGREDCSTVLLLFSGLLHRPFRNILGWDAIYRLGCWNILIIRNAFLEAFQALCDITHHIGKASFPEQQHYYNTDHQPVPDAKATRSEEHTSELQSLMRIPYAVFCLKKKNKSQHQQQE